MSFQDELEHRARQYTQRNGLLLGQELGRGIQGIVFTLADWGAEKQEQFGARWPEVQAIVRSLEGYGVFMLDVNPRNLSFGD